MRYSVEDIALMHEKFGVHEWIAENPDKLNELLRLRMRMLGEETMETIDAVQNNDPEEIVDGLIDVMVIALGTLDIVGVNAKDAWDEVISANLTKKVGVKPERPNPLGLPDLVKPRNWKAPNHGGNHGKLEDFLNG